MYKLNFNHLYHFLVIAKEGSIVKASKKLHMAQPALSHQLKLLEQDLGKKLFDRKGKRLVINSDGEAVREYASKIFRHSEEMLHFLSSEAENYIKIIRIGTLPWIPKNEIYQFVKPLISNPQIQLEVYQKDLETLLKDILSKKIDVILCDSPYSGRSKKLIGQRLHLDKIVCVASDKKSFKGKFPQNIQGKRLIHYTEENIMADKIDDFINRHNLKLNVVGAFSDTSLMKVTIAKSTMIGFLPLSEVKQELKSKNLVKLGELEKSKFSLWAITEKEYKSDGILNQLIKKFN